MLLNKARHKHVGSIQTFGLVAYTSDYQIPTVWNVVRMPWDS